MEELYNLHNDVVYTLKKMKKVEVPEEKLFCKIEAFPKQIIISVAIMKAGWVEYKGKCKVFL